jgi:uncharacterized protein (TIGR02266 family)
LTRGADRNDDKTMAESKRERRDHFRGKPRNGRRVQVRYRVLEHGQLSDEQRAWTKNVGIGGAFVLTTDPAPPGTAVQLTLEVPAHKPIEIRGNVRWIVDGKHDEPDGDHGMGIKFSSLDVDQLLALNEYFASLTATLDIDEA